ncbi:MAG: M3 family metallopeptidase [Saprospiraceae bacterium]|nr:M3 family metallopeptidase [Saprospiraceae bacterium]
MKLAGFYLLLCLVIAGIVACNKKKQEDKTISNDAAPNPLLETWTGNYNGFPPFDKIKLEHFKPAFEKLLIDDIIRIKAISENADAPTFQNTLEALEKNQVHFNNFLNLFYVWSSNLSTPEFQKLEEDIQPRVAAYFDKIYQNSSLFSKIETVYNSQELKSMTSEQQRLAWKYYTEFVYFGAKLNDEQKKKVADINTQLATLNTKFSQNLLADEQGKFLELTEKDTVGIPAELLTAAAEKAKAKKKSGWIISNTRSSIEPFLGGCPNRELREKAWRMFVNRGDNGDANDNNKGITEILRLRAERSKLYGYPTHAHWRLSNKMAKTPEAAVELLEKVWTPAVARVHEEVADMQKIADKEKAGIKIEPWDYRYYAEKVRKDKYNLDESEVKPYFQLEKMREGMFWMAGELFNMSFTQINDVPVFHPDVRVWKVSDKTSGKQIGLWYFDPYAREGKRSGAWMTAYREQSRFNGEVTTIVSNNSNFIKGKEGEPILISFDDATTLFHEFGHALHGLASNVTYPKLSGTNVATDYVEFPSQILERWLTTPEILNTYALHYQTGKPIPKELLQRIENSSKFNQGFSTVEYLASALVDMKLHLAGNQAIDPDAFERTELEKLKMPKEMVMRHRTPQFGHIFSDDGYSAGYYSYLWSDVHSADAYEAFTEGKGAYDKVVGKRLVDYVFSVGGTLNESEGYKKFRGKAPSIAALMKSRGFPYSAKK